MDVLTAITHRLADLTALLAQLQGQCREVEAEIAELEATQRTLRRFGPVAPSARGGSIKALVLLTLREAYPRGLNRRAIVARIRREHGVVVKPDTTTSSLCEWARAGLTRRAGTTWFATSGTGDLLDEA